MNYYRRDVHIRREKKRIISTLEKDLVMNSYDSDLKDFIEIVFEGNQQILNLIQKEFNHAAS